MDRETWSAEDLLVQKAEALTVQELDDAAATLENFEAEEKAAHVSAQGRFGNRHYSTEEARERWVEAGKKKDVALALAAKTRAEMEVARAARHEAFEELQQRMDAVVSAAAPFASSVEAQKRLHSGQWTACSCTRRCSRR